MSDLARDQCSVLYSRLFKRSLVQAQSERQVPARTDLHTCREIGRRDDLHRRKRCKGAKEHQASDFSNIREIVSSQCTQIRPRQHAESSDDAAQHGRQQQCQQPPAQQRRVSVFDRLGCAANVPVAEATAGKVWSLRQQGQQFGDEPTFQDMPAMAVAPFDVSAGRQQSQPQQTHKQLVNQEQQEQQQGNNTSSNRLQYRPPQPKPALPQHKRESCLISDKAQATFPAELDSATICPTSRLNSNTTAARTATAVGNKVLNQSPSQEQHRSPQQQQQDTAAAVAAVPDHVQQHTAPCEAPASAVLPVPQSQQQEHQHAYCKQALQCSTQVTAACRPARNHPGYISSAGDLQQPDQDAQAQQQQQHHQQQQQQQETHQTLQPASSRDHDASQHLASCLMRCASIPVVHSRLPSDPQQQVVHVGPAGPDRTSTTTSAAAAAAAFLPNAAAPGEEAAVISEHDLGALRTFSKLQWQDEQQRQQCQHSCHSNSTTSQQYHQPQPSHTMSRAALFPVNGKWLNSAASDRTLPVAGVPDAATQWPCPQQQPQLQPKFVAAAPKHHQQLQLAQQEQQRTAAACFAVECSDCAVGPSLSAHLSQCNAGNELPAGEQSTEVMQQHTPAPQEALPPHPSNQPQCMQQDEQAACRFPKTSDVTAAAAECAASALYRLQADTAADHAAGSSPAAAAAAACAEGSKSTAHVMTVIASAAAAHDIDGGKDECGAAAAAARGHAMDEPQEVAAALTSVALCASSVAAGAMTATADVAGLASTIPPTTPGNATCKLQPQPPAPAVAAAGAAGAAGATANRNMSPQLTSALAAAAAARPSETAAHNGVQSAVAADEQQQQQHVAAAVHEVCQLLSAVCVMLRLSNAAQLPSALSSLRALPELPELSEGRGLCSLCRHYEPLEARVVGSPHDRDWSVYCSNCYHNACQAVGRPTAGLHTELAGGIITAGPGSGGCAGPTLPSLQHKRAKALRERSQAMRVASDALIGDLMWLAVKYGSNVAVPDYSCTYQCRPGVIGPRVPIMPSSCSGSSDTDSSPFVVTQQQLHGILGGIMYSHLEAPVRAVQGDTASAATSAELASVMIERITQHQQYGQSNPVTLMLSDAAKHISKHVVEQQHQQTQQLSPLQQCDAAATAAAGLAQQEIAAAQQQQTIEEQNNAATAAVTAAFPQPTAEQQAAVAGQAQRRSKRNRRKLSLRSTQEQQQQQSCPKQPSPTCAWAVHMLNAFILLQLFSGVVGRTLSRTADQVVSSILLLMGLAGTRTPGHIDPAGALTFAWPLVLPGQQWHEGFMQQVLAVWLFISPSAEAWQLLVDWVVLRQQHASLRSRPAAAVEDALGQHEQADMASESDQVHHKPLIRNQPQQHKPVTSKQLQVAAELLLRGLELQPEELHDLAQHMGPHAVVVEQHAGEAVSVEPGWKHWVFNQQPCFKVAFELLRPHQAAAVVHMQQQLRGKMYVKQQDYMQVGCTVLQQLQQWAKWLKQQT